jgi:hypothetical protein
MTADDDLPRTIRREREAQREARERERLAREREAAAVSVPSIEHEGAYGALASPPATVTDFDVPFVRLMTFFIKAVFAAIPALVVLTAILWLFGKLLFTLVPELVHLKVDIQIYPLQSADDVKTTDKGPAQRVTTPAQPPRK